MSGVVSNYSRRPRFDRDIKLVAPEDRDIADAIVLAATQWPPTRPLLAALSRVACNPTIPSPVPSRFDAFTSSTPLSCSPRENFHRLFVARKRFAAFGTLIKLLLFAELIGWINFNNCSGVGFVGAVKLGRRAGGSDYGVR